jgi:adenylylsulfate kinase
MSGYDGSGLTVWLTGLPSAGKSTIAELVSERLRAQGEVRVEVLDGDIVRTHLSKGLGFSRQDRDENIRRIGFVASLLARNGVTVLVAVVSPYERARREAREMHQPGSFLEVHVATPLAVCSKRDVKGLYRKQQEGVLKGLTGVDDPYEEPSSPDLRLTTEGEAPSGSASRVLALIAESRDRFDQVLELA